MQWNQNSGYGRATFDAINSVGKSAGKTFVVCKNTNPNAQKFFNLFQNDPQAQPMFFGTIQAAIDFVGYGTVGSRADVIAIVPDTYEESITVPRTVGALTLLGYGPKGSVSIAPNPGSGQRAITFNNDDFTMINIDAVGAEEADFSVFGTGSRFRDHDCKYEGPTDGGAGLGFGPGSVADNNAGITGHSGDIKLDAPEFAFCSNGLALVASDYGTPTQVQVSNPIFHNVPGIHIQGIPSAFGVGSVRNLECKSGEFDNSEDATAPTKFVELNTAFDTGIFTKNSFSFATNASAKFDIGAGIFWVANATEAGFSTSRPS